MSNNFNLGKKIKSLCLPNSGFRGFYNNVKQDFDVISNAHFYSTAFNIYIQLAEFLEGKEIILISAASPFTTLTAFYSIVFSKSVPIIIPNRNGIGANADYTHYLQIIEETFPRSKIAILTDDPKEFQKKLNSNHLSITVLEIPSSKGINVIEHIQTELASEKLDKMDANNKSVAFYQFTSGSTSVNKLIAISNFNVFSNTKAIFERTKCTKDDVAISWLPLHHDMGLVGAELFCLLNDIPLYLMSPMDFIRVPENWFLMISKYSCTLSPFPNFAYEYCLKYVDVNKIANLSLISLRVLFNGSEPINIRLLSDFYLKFCDLGLKLDVFITCYGMAESTLAATIPYKDTSFVMSVIQHDQDLDYGVKVGCIEMFGLLSTKELLYSELALPALGAAIEGMSIIIVDEQGKRQQEGFLGEVLIRGDSVAKGGYIGKSIQRFNRKFATGDLGFIFNGNLYIVDRINNLITRNGKKYSLNLLENILANELSVLPSQIVVFETASFERELVVVIESIKPKESQLKVKFVIENKLGMFGIDWIIFSCRRIIPRTTSGKKQHFKCSTLFKTFIEDKDSIVVNKNGSVSESNRQQTG